MDDGDADDSDTGPDAHAWQPKVIWIPRIGMLLTRFETRRRVIWPGHYLVRRSRTLGRMLYRRN